MKRLFPLKSQFAICISFVFLSTNPFFDFNIYQAGQDGGPKAPLERLTAKLQTVKGKNTSSVYEIAGAKSTRRIYAVESLFNASPDQLSAKADPATVIQLYKLEAGKNKRIFSLTSDVKVQSSMIAISFQPVDFGSTYKIIINGYLTPGEYAFIDKTSTTADGSVTVFAFGID